MRSSVEARGEGRLTHVLGRNQEVLSSHVDPLESVSAGQDEEYPGTSESSIQAPAQPVHHGSLVLLDPLHGEQQGEGEGDHHQQPGEEDDQFVTELGRVSNPVC